jgi:hypothetical protein
MRAGILLTCRAHFGSRFARGRVDGSYCANVDATFCDDFDTAPLAILWGSRYQRGGASADHDPYDAAPSMPNTLLVTVPSSDASTDPANRTAFLSRTVPFAIKAPWGNTPGAYHSLTMYLYAAKGYAYEQDSLPDAAQTVQGFANLFVSPTPGKSTEISIAIDINPDGGRSTLTVSLDGTIQGYYSGSSGLLPGWSLASGVEIDLGDTYLYGSSSAWRLRYDNVTVRAY